MSNTGSAILHKWIVGDSIHGYTESLYLTVPSDTTGTGLVGEIGSGEIAFPKWKVKNIPVVSGEGSASLGIDAVEGNGAGSGSLAVEVSAQGTGVVGVIGQGKVEFPADDVAAFGGGSGSVLADLINSVSGNGRINEIGSGSITISMDVTGSGHVDNVSLSTLIPFKFGVTGHGLVGPIGQGSIEFILGAKGSSDSVAGTGAVAFNFYLTGSGYQSAFGTGSALLHQWLLFTDAKIDDVDNDWSTLEYRRHEFYE